MIKLIYYTLYTLLYAGWLFHQSTENFFLGYSKKYFILLILLLLPFTLPAVLNLLRNKLGKKRFKNLSLFLAFLISFLYLSSSQYYYYTRKHAFDPFIQIPFNPVPKNIDKEFKDSFRVLCLGGSTTYNRRLSSEKKYPSQLKKILAEHYPQRKIEVINGGMDFFTTKHSLINYSTYYQEWNPDLVVVMHGINDLFRSFSPPNYAQGPYNKQWSHYYGHAAKAANPPSFEKFWLDYFLYDVQEAWLSSLRFKKIDIPLEDFLSINDYEINLQRLVRTIQQNETPVVLVTQPYLYKPDISAEEKSSLWMNWEFGRIPQHTVLTHIANQNSMEKAMKKITDLTLLCSKNRRTLICDAEKEIPKSLLYFKDDVHYTARGAQQLSQLVGETIIQSGIITPEQ